MHIIPCAWSYGEGRNHCPAALFLHQICPMPKASDTEWKKKKIPLFLYYPLLGTDFIPGPQVPALHVRTYHPQARPSGLEARRQTPRVTEEGTGEKTAQAGTELRSQCLQKKLMAAKRTQTGRFHRFALFSFPAGISCPLPKVVAELRISSHLFFQ